MFKTALPSTGPHVIVEAAFGMSLNNVKSIGVLMTLGIVVHNRNGIRTGKRQATHFGCTVLAWIAFGRVLCWDQKCLFLERFMSGVGKSNTLMDYSSL